MKKIEEQDKAKRILKELAGYFFDNKIYEFDLNVQFNTEALTITISGEVNAEPKSFRSLMKDLSLPRQMDIDEYYNALLGSHTHYHDDYSLLGEAIDVVEGKFEDGRLSIKLVRNQ